MAAQRKPGGHGKAAWTAEASASTPTMNAQAPDVVINVGLEADAPNSAPGRGAVSPRHGFSLATTVEAAALA